MELPNYFIADLPAEAKLSPDMISEACRTLKRNRAQYLAHRTTQSLIGTLCGVAQNWLQPDFPLRKILVEQGPRATGFSATTLIRGFEQFFRQFDNATFNALLEQDLGHALRLDTMVATDPEERAQRGGIATGPEFLMHIAAGNVPNPAWMSLVLGLLTHSAQFMKCGRGTSLLPRLFAHSIHEADPKLASCIEIAEWAGGTQELEEPLFQEADCITVTGSDETLSSVRARVPARARCVAYGHRLSFAYITREALSGFNPKKWVNRAVDDVVAWDQLGCLSPHVFYVENGGKIQADRFAEMLAEGLEAREQTEPRGEVDVQTAALISSRRRFYEVRMSVVPDIRLWFSKDSTKWTVILETDPLFQVSCLHRFVYVKSVANLDEVLHGAESVRSVVSTVGLATSEDKAETIATHLARWGARRVCALGQMQNPPLTWRHDGHPSLGDLVTWTDWERADSGS